MTSPVSNFGYAQSVGGFSTAPFISLIMTRPPTTSDVYGTNGQYHVGQRWIDTSGSNQEYFLLNYSSSGGVVTANWVQLGGSTFTETLTGNTGGAVTPDSSNNINIVGTTATGISFAGSSHTLTASLSAIPNSALANSSITLTGSTSLGISVTGSPVSLGGTATIATTFANSTVSSLFISYPGNPSAAIQIDQSTNLTSFTAGNIALSRSNPGGQVRMDTVNASAAVGSVVIDVKTVTASDAASIAYSYWNLSGSTGGYVGWYPNNSTLRMGIGQNGPGQAGATDGLLMDTSGNVTCPVTLRSPQLYATGDVGGSVSTTGITNANSTTIGAGTGTVKMSTANSANSAAWIKIYVGATAYWIPAWTTNAP